MMMAEKGRRREGGNEDERGKRKEKRVKEKQPEHDNRPSY
jgi:hypothetical protein